MDARLAAATAFDQFRNTDQSYEAFLRVVADAISQAVKEREGIAERLSEREEFIRQNAGPLLAERDAKIDRQRRALQKLTEQHAQRKLALTRQAEENERLRAEIERLNVFISESAQGQP